MVKINELSTVLLITSNPQLAEEIQVALDKESGFILTDSIRPTDNPVETIRAAQPSIILIDCQVDEEANLKVIDDIASRYSSGAVVSILLENQARLSNRVILAGARAILLYPFSRENLIFSLHRVNELQLRNVGAIPTPPPAKTPVTRHGCFVVYSPKGGVGCTTVAINLAIALRQQVKEKVLLIDGKHILGHVALMLNLRTVNSIVDLLNHAEKLDEALIKQVVIEHTSGISFLPSPPTFEKGQEIKPEDLYKVFQALKSVYPVIIVDGGNYLNENLITYMDMADYILVVTNPDLASLRDTRQFLDISRSLAYSKDKILPLLNKVGLKADVKLQEIEKVLRVKMLGTIPANEDLLLSCVNEGIPIILKKSNHPISQAFKNIAKSMVKILSSPTLRADEKIKSSTDVLKKSSYLG
jgi:pilus assembly protein CpaE